MFQTTSHFYKRNDEKQRNAVAGIEETLSHLSGVSGHDRYLGRSKLMAKAKSSAVGSEMKVYMPVGYTRHSNNISKDAAAQC